MADTEETETAKGARSQMYLHEALAEYIEEQTGETLSKLEPAQIISLAFAHRNAWRATDGYAELKEERQAQRAKEAEERKAARAAAKAAKATEAKAAKATEAKSTKSTSKKATAKAPAKAAARGRRKAAAKDTPFEE